MQLGNSPTGTPGWVATARPFLLGSILFGYFFSAALFLTSAALMKRDKLKLETVMQTGSLESVRRRLLCLSCLGMHLQHWVPEVIVGGFEVFIGGRAPLGSEVLHFDK